MAEKMVEKELQVWARSSFLYTVVAIHWRIFHRNIGEQPQSSLEEALLLPTL